MGHFDLKRDRSPVRGLERQRGTYAYQTSRIGEIAVVRIQAVSMLFRVGVAERGLLALCEPHAR